MLPFSHRAIDLFGSNILRISEKYYREDQTASKYVFGKRVWFASLFTSDCVMSCFGCVANISDEVGGFYDLDSESCFLVSSLTLLNVTEELMAKFQIESQWSCTAPMNQGWSGANPACALLCFEIEEVLLCAKPLTVFPLAKHNKLKQTINFY